MAKDKKPADQMDAFSKQAMAQAHEALEIYFDFLKRSVSFFPSGGAELGEKLKDQSVQNIIAVRELVKKLAKRRILKKHFEFRPNLCSPNSMRLGSKLKVLARRIPKKPQVGSRCHSKVRLIRAFV